VFRCLKSRAKRNMKRLSGSVSDVPSSRRRSTRSRGRNRIPSAGAVGPKQIPSGPQLASRRHPHGPVACKASEGIHVLSNRGLRRRYRRPSWPAASSTGCGHDRAAVEPTTGAVCSFDGREQ
jgi:hypothetical protein